MKERESEGLLRRDRKTFRKMWGYFLEMKGGCLKENERLSSYTLSVRHLKGAVTALADRLGLSLRLWQQPQTHQVHT